MRLFIEDLQQIKWNVRIERPMAGIEKVVEYLGRYVYRTAITNGRIHEVGEKTVRLEVKKYAQRTPGQPAEKDELELEGVEFLRRFAQHLLQKGAQRIRYFGLYAAAAKDSLRQAEAAIGTLRQPFIARKVVEIVTAFLGHPPDDCPVCNTCRTWSTVEIMPKNPYHRPQNWRQLNGPLFSGKPPPKADNRLIVNGF